MSKGVKSRPPTSAPILLCGKAEGQREPGRVAAPQTLSPPAAASRAASTSAPTVAPTDGVSSAPRVAGVGPCGFTPVSNTTVL